MQVGQLKWIEKYVGSMQELGGHHRVAAGEEPTKRTNKILRWVPYNRRSSRVLYFLNFML